MKTPRCQYWFFVLLSFIYFLLLIEFFGVNLADIQDLEPNELGDFLAGSFSPLAFLFLILGYLQNNKNLGQNTEALTQQAKALQQQAESLKLQAQELKTSNQALQDQANELKKSVEQQVEQVRIANEQLEYYRSKDLSEAQKEALQAKPRLHLKRNQTGTGGDGFKLHNYGGDAIEVKSNIGDIHIPKLSKNQTHSFSLKQHTNNISFTYTDNLGNTHTTKFVNKDSKNSNFESID